LSVEGPDSAPSEARDSLAPIQQEVHEQIIGSRRRWTFPNIERHVAQREGCPRSLVRAAIRGLIEKGILEYNYTFGQSYLALSFRNPVDVSPLFTIVPPDYAGNILTRRHGIAIAPGVSFGSGRHPTTRLALQALEEGWFYLKTRGLPSIQSAIDIGTGSGILAIAASYLGAKAVMALDVDACARSEARQNVNLNQETAAAVTVTDTPLDTIKKRFDIVIANLRLPTLIHLSTWIPTHLQNDGCVVVSGFREEEWERLLACYASHGFHSLGQRAQAGWSAALFCRVNADYPRS